METCIAARSATRSISLRSSRPAPQRYCRPRRDRHAGRGSRASLTRPLPRSRRPSPPCPLRSSVLSADLAARAAIPTSVMCLQLLRTRVLIVVKSNAPASAASTASVTTSWFHCLSAPPSALGSRALMGASSASGNAPGRSRQLWMRILMVFPLRLEVLLFLSLSLFTVSLRLFCRLSTSSPPLKSMVLHSSLRNLARPEQARGLLWAR